MASDDLSLGKAFAVLLGASSPVIIYYGAYRTGLLAKGWRWLRVMTLGGVTTLERKLSYNCAICQDSMDVLEEVRTLSCNHVFHCRKTDKCKNVIDKWLLTQPKMFCPVCRKTPRVVLPWKAPPPASPAPAASTDEEQLEPSAAAAGQEQPESSAAAAGQEQPGSSSSRLEDTAPPQSSRDLEDPLPPPSQ
ncbi:hypothetical protein HU200_031735 [Digitaria exilis]|uniref:RING-type domain-containing protein n=1 Tax=Digitaria exilis TaxID=1010633 RepID=A0A835BPP7_9POAL|nr:hypothetical protein HU200_031735 [Digitaria exilis]CAB3485007.1 unnamed protein product [Digitaria exilis]